MSGALLARPAIELKPDSSYVTDTDKGIERALRAMIETQFPAHGILGEEYGAQNANAEYVWVLDPIDGTAAFVAGLPVFGTLIALLHEGVPVIGVIDHLMTNDRWIGALGRPTTRNGAVVHTRQCPSLAQAMLSASNPDFFSAQEQPLFERIRSRTQWHAMPWAGGHEQVRHTMLYGSGPCSGRRQVGSVRVGWTRRLCARVYSSAPAAAAAARA